MSKGDIPAAMPCRAATKPPAQNVAAPTPQATPRMMFFALSAETSKPAATFLSGRLTAGEEVAHAIERLQDVVRGVGVGKAHIALTQDAEVGTADDGDASLLQQRRGERFGPPSGALDVRKGIERSLGRGAGDAGQAVQPFDHHFAALVEL